MRRPSRSGRLLVAVLAIALAGVWAIPQVRVTENRVPPTWPTPSWAGFEDASLFRGVDNVLTDRIPTKGPVVHRTADAIVSAGLSPRADVWRGDGGTPFLSDDFTRPCAPGAGAAAGMREVDRLSARLAKADTRFLYAIVPDKSGVLRDRLGPQADGLMVCADRVRASWDAVDDPRVLTAWDEFATARAAGEDLYFAGDTHWNWHGAARYSQLLLDRLATLGAAPAGLDVASELRSTGEVEHLDDLYLIMGVQRTEPVEQLVVERPGVTTTQEELQLGERWSSTSTERTSPLIGGRTLVLRDSMFDYDGKLLAPYFADLTAVWMPDFLAQGGRMDGYDLVIIQQVQRSSPSYLDNLVATAPE